MVSRLAKPVHHQATEGGGGGGAIDQLRPTPGRGEVFFRRHCIQRFVAALV